MANESKRSIPLAILLGSTIISLGIFFGLKQDPPLLPSESPPATPNPSSSTAAPSPPDRVAVAHEVEALIGKQKKSLSESCLSPSLAKKPEPSRVLLTFNFTFGADGKQLSRGVVEERETSRPDVTQCVSEKLSSLHIKPPGQNVFVEIPLELP